MTQAQLGFRRAGLQACSTRKGPLARPSSLTWRFVRIGRSPDVWVFRHVGGNDVDHSQEVLEGRHLGSVQPVVDGAGLHAELLRKSVDVSESGNRKVERLSKDAAHDVGIVGQALTWVCALSDILASPGNDLISLKGRHFLYV